MRIAVADLLGLGQLKPLVEVLGVCFRRGAGFDPVTHRRLGELVDQPVRRIEGGRRALGDIGDACAPQGPRVIARGTAQLHAVEHDIAAGEPAARPGEAHGREPDGGLAGA